MACSGGGNPALTVAQAKRRVKEIVITMQVRTDMWKGHVSHNYIEHTIYWWLSRLVSQQNSNLPVLVLLAKLEKGVWDCCECAIKGRVTWTGHSNPRRL